MIAGIFGRTGMLGLEQLVDEGEIVKHHGHTDPYLQQH